MGDENCVSARPALALPPLPPKPARVWPTERILSIRTMQEFDDVARELKISTAEVRDLQRQFFWKRYRVEI